MRFPYPLSFLFALILLASCSKATNEQATLLIYGGPIYTVDSTQTTVEAVAVKDSIILFAGSMEEAEKYATAETQRMDLEGKTITKIKLLVF